MTRDDVANPSRRELAALAGIGLLGLVVRALWLHGAMRLPFFSLPQTDDYVYAHGAARIAAGDVFLSGEPLRFGPPYFYVLALVGGEGLAPRVLHVAAGLGTVACVWWASREVTRSPTAALLGAALSALYGPAIFFEALLLPETLMTLAHAALACLLLRALPRSDPRAWALVGVIAGVAIAFRPNAALLLVPIVWLASHASEGEAARPRILRVAAVLATMLAALVPLALRNVIALGRPWAASTAGINAYIGNGPGATGAFRVPREVPGAASPLGQFTGFRDAAAERLGHPVTDAEADGYWLARTLDHVASDPAAALHVLARKAWLFWNARELSNLVDYEFLRTVDPTLGAPLVQFAWIAPLALAGMLVSLAPKRSRGEQAIAALLLAAFVSVVLVFVQDRYRLPFVPFAVVTAVATGKHLVDAVRARDTRAIAITVALVAAALFVVFPPARMRAHPERSWAALGAGYLELGDRGAACDAFQRALAIAPDFEDASRGARSTCR